MSRIWLADGLVPIVAVQRGVNLASFSPLADSFNCYAF